MATVTINGTELASDELKMVQRALAKARRDEKKAEAIRIDSYNAAVSEAERNGYKILTRKASGDSFPHGWRIYYPSDKWASHLFTTGIDDDGCFIEWKTRLIMSSPAVLSHYSCRFIGAVSDSSGYTWLIFLQEVVSSGTGVELGEIKCYAVGSHDGAIALADCPGVSPSDFRTIETQV